MTSCIHENDLDAFSVSERSQALLGNFVTKLTWEELPAGVRQAATLCLLDTLAAMLVGLLTPVAQITADYAVSVWGGTEATVVASRRRSSALGAAFANATAANATDLDDCGVYTWGHPGAQIVPTALAVAEAQGRTGQELLEALVVGYELAFRAGRCSHDFHQTYRACGSWGSVSCSAVAARLMGLSSEITKGALGVADYFSPFLPMMRDIDHPAMAKHGIGLGALTGIMSAQLADRGFTGPPALIESERYEAWISDLGDRYLIDGGVVFKEHSCCAWTHPALLATRRLRERYNVSPARVVRIDVETYEQACRLHVKQPRTTEEAQFSLPWTIAVMLVDGRVGPDQVLEARLRDPLVRRLAESVVSHSREDLTELHALSEDFDAAGMDSAAVKIKLDDGTVLDSGLVDLAVKVLSREEVEEKFISTTKGLPGQAARDAIIGLVDHLHRESSVAGLVEALLEAGNEPKSPTRLSQIID
jgi:2-methylcitrate dehydratase PrpD